MAERDSRRPAGGPGRAVGEARANGWQSEGWGSGGSGAARSTRTDGGPARAGQATDPEAGPDADPEAVARQICLRMLTVAPRTQAQLAAALRRRRVPAAAAEAVLARFAEV